MRFAGDDTAIFFKVLADRTILVFRMSNICAPSQTKSVHGLGLVLKKPNIDFKKVNLLSRNIAVKEGQVVVTRMPAKIILTSSMQPKTL